MTSLLASLIQSNLHVNVLIFSKKLDESTVYMVKFEESDEQMIKQVLDMAYNLTVDKLSKEGGIMIDETIKVPETYKIPFWMSFTIKTINDLKENNTMVQFDYKFLVYELKPGSEEFKNIKTVSLLKILNLTFLLSKIGNESKTPRLLPELNNKNKQKDSP